MFINIFLVIQIIHYIDIIYIRCIVGIYFFIIGDVNISEYLYVTTD